LFGRTHARGTRKRRTTGTRKAASTS
jgi:hypothetical protein